MPDQVVQKATFSPATYDVAEAKPNWCPGCGDFGIWVAVKMALAQLQLPPHEVVLVADIGCSSKMPYWVKSYGFQGLHGRAVPLATGVKLANQKLNIFIIAGDGGAYGEGGNHFLHACRRNLDMVYIIHDNGVYGLTTGQVAPTAEHGFKTKSSPEPVIEVPFNPLAIAISAGATYVARGFAGDVKHLVSILTSAHQHRGFAVVDVLQPCVTYNHLNTYQYYFQRTYKLDEDTSYNVGDKVAAFQKAQEWGEKIPIGLFYKADRSLYTDELPQVKDVQLAHQDRSNIDISSFLKSFA
ncbi:MAG: 2-oxoacid:ferredoxin oxidoreductase subunit beta [bacterium]|nr:2-oxoacid:ferredoxin oxidoreductase subunit beta [bacterium]